MRIRSASRRILVIILLLAPALAFGQQEVGRIVSVDGYAEIDAFGTGRFIVAEAGDVLYESSVLRTEYESWVTTRIADRTYEIAPSSTTRVGAFLSGRRTAASPGLLGRLLRGIVESLAPPEEDVADFGGRAAEIQGPGSMGGMFVVDVEPDEEFALGREALDSGDFRAAVDHFRRIEYPEDGTFSLTEYYVSLSYALMGLGDFDAAVHAAFEYALEDPSVDGIASLPPRLQLLAAIGAYYTGDDELALAASTAYVDELGLDEADARAIAIRIILTREREPSRARQLEREARGQRPDADWNALLGG
jgi:hypothetical protein